MLSFNRLVQGSIALVGGVGVVVMMAGSARAEGASVTGAVTYTTPGSYSLSISAQKVAPAGYKFDGDVQVTVQGVSGSAPIGLTVSAGTDGSADGGYCCGSDVEGGGDCEIGDDYGEYGGGFGCLLFDFEGGGGGGWIGVGDRIG
jgi:hypothetical protein